MRSFWVEKGQGGWQNKKGKGQSSGTCVWLNAIPLFLHHHYMPRSWVSKLLGQWIFSPWQVKKSSHAENTSPSATPNIGCSVSLFSAAAMVGGGGSYLIWIELKPHWSLAILVCWCLLQSSSGKSRITLLTALYMPKGNSLPNNGFCSLATALYLGIKESKIKHSLP